MQNVLSDFPWRKVIVYIDDVLIMSETFEEHLELVGKVIETLSSCGVTLNAKKCKWFCKEVEFLGHTVSPTGLAKPASYVAEIDDFPRPTTVTELRRFLGLVNFQRKFVRNCSLIMKPLSEATGGKKKKSFKVSWTPAMEEAFINLKTAMREALILAFPDYSAVAEPLSLFTDASGTGSGACLAQVQDGALRPIAFASISFNSAEVNYSTLDRELAAIRWGVKTFRPFLFGVDFLIHTDHMPLVHLYNMQIVNDRLARTLQELSQYTFVIRYTPGRDNLAADSLSRVNHNPLNEETLIPGTLPKGLLVTTLVPGGGDSLVLSLLSAGEYVDLRRPLPEDSTDLRKLLVGEMLKDPEHFMLKKSKGLTRQLKLMTHHGQLMCAEAILSFSRLFGCVILVHYGGDIPVIYVDSSKGSIGELPRLHLQCISGIHYNPVMESGMYHPPEVLHSSLGASCIVEAPTQQPEGEVETSGEERDEIDDHCDDVVVAVASPILSPQWCNQHMYTQLFSLMAICKETPCCILFDTGAQVSCVSSKVVQQYGSTINTDIGYTIRGIGSQSANRILGEAEVAITMPDGVLVTHTFAVVPDEVMEYCMIFGVDLISSNCLKLDAVDGTCYHPFGAWRFHGTFTRGFSPPSMVISVTELSTPDTGSGGIMDGCSPCPVGLIDPAEILSMQRGNTQLKLLSRSLRKGEATWPRSLRKFRRYQANLLLRDEIIYYANGGTQLTAVVPFTCMVEVALVLHYQTGHPGRQKLLATLLGQVWHPGITGTVADITRTCEQCQKVKVSAIQQPPVTRIRTTTPFELVAVDLMMLPTARGGCMYVLVVIDHNSKWLSVVPLTSKSSAAVAAAMKKRVLPYLPRIPTRVLSDNGREFTAGEFRDLMAEFGINHGFTTPYKPSSNGLVERVNRTVLELLRNLSAKTGTWTEDLPKVVTCYNNSYHAELKMSPSAYILTTAHDLKPQPVLPSAETEYWREGNPSFVPFKLGQQVLRKVIFKGRQVVDKLAERFHGPYKIVFQQANRVTYRIEHCETGVKHRVHHSQLRRFYLPPQYLQGHTCYQRLVQGITNIHSEVDDEHVTTGDGTDGELPVGNLTDGEVHRGTVFPSVFDYGSIWTDSQSSGSDSSCETEAEPDPVPVCSFEPRDRQLVDEDFLNISLSTSAWLEGLEAITRAERGSVDGTSVCAEHVHSCLVSPINQSHEVSSEAWSALDKCSLFSTLSDQVSEPPSDNDSLPIISGVLSCLESTPIPSFVYVDNADSSEDSDTVPVMYRFDLSGNIQRELGEINALGGNAYGIISPVPDLAESPNRVLSESLGGLEVSIDCIKDIIDATDSARSMYWLPRRLAALDLAPTLGVSKKVSGAVNRVRHKGEVIVKSHKALAESDPLIETSLKRIKSMEGRLKSLLPLLSNTVVPDEPNKVESKQLPSLSPRVTRSRGHVPVYPNVQPVTLEYRSKKRSHQASLAPSGEECSD
jgi:hypothetical protein